MTKRICVVGAGKWGRNHVRTLKSMDCLAGIVESNAGSHSELSIEFPGVAIFPEISKVPFEKFDGFVVATPAETHFGIAEQIIKQKKHVLVEKPLSMTAVEAKKLQAAARDVGVNLMVGHILLFHPAIRMIKDLVDQGKIGKLEYLYSNRLNLGTVRKEENILWSFAPHDISIFQYLIGEFPQEIISRGGAFLQPHIHDTTMTILKYPNNVIGHIFVSWLHPFKEQRLVVIGTKGMLSFEDSSQDKQLLFYEKGIDWVKGEPVKREGPTEIIAYDKTPPLLLELQYFAERLDGKEIKIAGSQNAIDVLEILEKATHVMSSAPAATSVKDPNAGRNYYVHPTAIVDDNVRIGKGTKIWHFSHVQGGSIIGENCVLGQNVNIGNNVKIGNGIKIQNNVSVYEGVELEDYVFCGPSMVFTNILQPRSEFPQRGSEFYRKTLVKKSASLGANCTVVCGHTIGQYAFVGAGSVVTKDVPDFALVIGNPARFFKWVCKCGNGLEFKSKVKKTRCGRCGREYAKAGDRIKCEKDI
jgi:UDP-2-acetamido-3-amino-2,3-dideoxy-glucuronate N-acetyltransferase